MKLLTPLMILLASFISPAFGADLPPDAIIKNTAQEVLTIIKKDKDILNGNSQKIVDLVEQKVLPHFDFERMTRLAVGRAWKTATPEQQKALIHEFRTLLVRTYSTTLTQYRDQTVEYIPVKMDPGQTDVDVETKVIQPGAQPIQIVYSMEKTDAGWKVYNIAVDAASLVITYRSSFASEIRNHGIDGLIKTLADKNQSLKGSSLSRTVKKAS